MEALEGDFHDSSSSFDEILDFEFQEYPEEPSVYRSEEEAFYRSLDEY